jgi:Flp pilus assembly protein TadD
MSQLQEASASMQQGSFAGAAESLRPLAEGHCDPRASLLLAAALEQSGDTSGAKTTLVDAHAHWPANHSIAASLARQYMANQQVAEAGAALKLFHATASTPMQEMQLATVVLIASHQLASAHAVADTAYRAHPSLETLLMLANTLQLEGRFKDVVALLNAKRAQSASSPEFLITLAESEYDSILYNAAREDLEHAVALDANSYQAHFLLGNTLAKADRSEEAIAEYRKAIELSPGQPRTYYQLALLLEAKQDQQGAREQLEKALSLDPHYGPALIAIGRLLIAQNHLPEAVASLQEAVQENPRAEQGYFLLAKAYAQLGDTPKSEEMARRLVQVRNANTKGSGTLEPTPGKTN